jgi:hydrogenase maturation protein HypF
LHHLSRIRLTLHGRVQGLGFRPFVFRVATRLGLAGGVRNVPSGVEIEVEGPDASLGRFREALDQELPPLASFRVVAETTLDPLGDSAFLVWPSEQGRQPTALVLPDLATCPECRAEVFDPSNRRYRYPFTNCTYCGPRFSIIQGIPYDRERTTMRRFSMCPECAAEYHDPRNRRFHAQPNACPACGPSLTLWDNGILALKGLGGFQLIVDAGNAAAVERLRQAKRREAKPFAVMAPSLDWVGDACDLESGAASLLASPEAPILLLSRRAPAGEVAENVAPRNPNLGVMLPTTSLHHLLLADLRRPVVATSGNRSDEPICIDEREALERLHDIADMFLVHDRPIERPVDDSVVRMMAGEPVVLRRARGYAPLPVTLATALPPTLAVGAHLKSTVALSVGQEVFLSQHLGDLETPEARDAFDRACADLPRLYAVDSPLIACDTHPDYHSTRRAASLGSRVEAVQHHHAHVAACVAENGADLPVLGVSWDGTGHGPDGTVWGGEWLLVEPGGYQRVAHLATFRLPGGEAAVREPRRSALGLLFEAWGKSALDRTDLEPVGCFSSTERRLMVTALDRGVNAPRTSSAGRLFDAVAALVGLRQVTAFEGQAAMELEFALARDADQAPPYPFAMLEPEDAGGALVVGWEPLIATLLDDLKATAHVSFLSARFHNTLVEMIVAVARRMGQPRVALSGGCFQNRYLTERAVRRLQEEGFEPLRHRRVPPNDGGVALGQVVVASQRLAGGGQQDVLGSTR